MNEKPPLLTAVDLFSGAGGFTAGLEDAGITVVGAADRWAPAVETYGLNFSHPILSADLAKTDAGALLEGWGLPAEFSPDLVVGGPPCQGFSVQRIGADNDERNSLVLSFAERIKELRPRYVVMENVVGLAGKRGRDLLEAFRVDLTAAGYGVEIAVVNAADFGVPQLRRRLLVLGTRADQPPMRLPMPTHAPERHVTVWEVIGDLPSPPADHTPHPAFPLHRKMRLSEKNLERLKVIPAGKGFESLPVDLRVDCHKAGAQRIGHRNVYGRLAGDRPAGTITARFDSFTRGKFAHPVEDRNISLREGARLQTFPDSFRFEGSQEEIAALIGNAVPPRLARSIGAAVVLAASGHHQKTAGTVPRGAPQLPLFG